MGTDMHYKIHVPVLQDGKGSNSHVIIKIIIITLMIDIHSALTARGLSAECFAVSCSH